MSVLASVTCDIRCLNESGRSTYLVCHTQISMNNFPTLCLCLDGCRLCDLVGDGSSGRSWIRSGCVISHYQFHFLCPSFWFGIDAHVVLVLGEVEIRRAWAVVKKAYWWRRWYNCSLMVIRRRVCSACSLRSLDHGCSCGLVLDSLTVGCLRA